MAKRKYTKKPRKKLHKSRKRNWLFRRKLLLVLFAVVLLILGFYLKQKIAFYYAIKFKDSTHNNLTNSKFESERITKIIGNNTDKIFGFDLSHYQKKEDIKWDSLSVGNQSIPLQFVLLRATMGERTTDIHFQEFWQLAKKHDLIRGAYHFYRVNEDPVAQANHFLNTVTLESGDLLPVLDVEKIPRRKSTEKLKKDLKIWLKIVEQAYGKKPIIYTYFYFYKDYLREDFADYPVWLANYNDVPAPTPNGNWDFWQFSEKGIVYGINTKIDLNIYNGGLWRLQAMRLP